MSDIHLLPPNASTLEEAVANAINGEINSIPVPIRDLMRPQSCPVALLPWLAWTLSVDSWSSTWPEQIKRDVIAASIEIHRRKGTIGALTRALDALGVAAEVAEWFDHARPPGTMRLIAWANDNLGTDGEILSQQLYDQLRTTIDQVKRWSIHLDLIVGARFDSNLGVVSSLQGLASSQPTALAKRQYNRSNHLGVASSLHHKEVTRPVTNPKRHGLLGRVRYSPANTLQCAAICRCVTTNRSPA